MMPQSARYRRLRNGLPLAAITLLIALLTLNRLGAADVCGGSEAAMAVYVQQMVERHNLLFPLDNCSIPMYKPPLYHWTATGLASLLHETTATTFNLRLPSALYAIAGAVITMLFAGFLLGRRAAILAGLILCGSYQYISQARIGLVDMTLTFFEALALYAFFGWFVLRRVSLASRSRVTLAHYIFAIAMGLAVLAKGPVGIILPGASAVLFLAVQRNWSALRDLIKPGPIVVGATVASSWYLACLLTGHYAFLSLQMGSENFGRFFGSLGTMSPWYYVQPILLNSLPLSLLVPIAVGCSMYAYARPSAPPDEPSCAAQSVEEDRVISAIGLLAIFWIFTVMFFAIASYKRRAYLLPLWPASAVLLAWWVVDYLARPLNARVGDVIYRPAVGLCLVLAVANFVFIPPYELRECGAPFTIGAMFRWPSTGFAGESSPDAVQVKSYRQAAKEINRLTYSTGPLYVIGMDDALEPIVFYLGHCIRPLGSWRNTPSDGFVITTASAWERAHVSGWAPMAHIPYGKDDLVLLRPSASAPGEDMISTMTQPR